MERGNEVLGMEVHGRGIDNGVNVLAFEQAHGVVVGVDAGNFGFGQVAAAGVGICHGHTLDIGLPESISQILHAAVAGADEADADAVVGAKSAHGRHGGDSERALANIADEISPIHEFTSEDGNVYLLDIPGFTKGADNVWRRPSLATEGKNVARIGTRSLCNC